MYYAIQTIHVRANAAVHIIEPMRLGNQYRYAVYICHMNIYAIYIYIGLEGPMDAGSGMEPESRPVDTMAALLVY